MRLLARALAPLVLIVAALVYQRMRQRPAADALPFILWVTFLVFSAVSSPAFQAFSCEGFDDNRYFLRADYSVMCYDADGDSTEEYYRIRMLATVVILLYPVAIPLLYAGLLFCDRSNALRSTRVSSALGFLTSNYTEPCFFWELVEVVKRLLLSSFFALPFMRPGTLLQLIAATAVQLTFLVLTIHARPYRHMSENLFSTLVNMALVFTLFSCMVLEQEQLVDFDFDNLLSQEMARRLNLQPAPVEAVCPMVTTASLFTECTATLSLSVACILLLSWLLACHPCLLACHPCLLLASCRLADTPLQLDFGFACAYDLSKMLCS